MWACGWSSKPLVTAAFIQFKVVTTLKRRLSLAANLQRHLLFFGSDSFSVGVFRELLNSRVQFSRVEACVVSPRVLFAKYLAVYHPDVRVHIWPSLPAVSSQDQNKVALVASFGKLIPESFISSLPNRIINIHPSLLPRWRGAAPLPRCIMAGDLVVGVSVMEVAPKKFDVGKVLFQKEVVPNAEMRVDQLSNTLATVGVRLFVENVWPNLGPGLSSIAKDQANLPYRSTLARRLNHSDLAIDWSKLTATEVARLFGATLATDHHHRNVAGQLRTSYDKHIIRLMSMDLMPALDVSPELANDTSHHPGRIIFDQNNKGRLLVKCKLGWVSVRRLIFRKPMTAADFHNGYLSKKPESAHYFE